MHSVQCVTVAVFAVVSAALGSEAPVRPRLTLQFRHALLDAGMDNLIEAEVDLVNLPDNSLPVGP
jgi:hypothetical protein